MSDVTENAATPAPRPVIGRLPAYKAGKPPVVIPGLQPYKLSSNENPGTPVPVSYTHLTLPTTERV